MLSFWRLIWQTRVGEAHDDTFEKAKLRKPHLNPVSTPFGTEMATTDTEFSVLLLDRGKCHSVGLNRDLLSTFQKQQYQHW